MPTKKPYDGAAALAFDALVRSEGRWLFTAASLMRGAHAVLRQVEVDARARQITSRSGVVRRLPRARLHQPAVFLAALAVENALKGAIVARGLVPKPPEGLLTELPGLLKHHDLAELAKHAKVKPTDEHEREALANGELYVMALGRYHITRKLSDYPDKLVTDPFVLVPAYRRLYLGAVETVAREECTRQSYDRATRRLYVARVRPGVEAITGGVYHASEDESLRDVF